MLLFLFIHSGINAQNSKSLTEKSNQKQYIDKRSTAVTPIDSVKLKRPAKASLVVRESKTQESSINYLEQEKVKKEGTINTHKEKTVSELDEIASAYWRVQTEIKNAKLNNDLKLIEELEINSVKYRKRYISAFEDQGNPNSDPEIQKLYLQFKKDFIHE